MSDVPVTDPANITTLSQTTEETPWFTPHESCDLCVSQSYYVVVFEAGSLYFCKHHFNANEASFFEKAIDIIDESELLGSSSKE